MSRLRRKWASLNCKNSWEDRKKQVFPSGKLPQQARNENGYKIFEMFRQGEEEVCIVSLARWNAQLKGLVELEKSCQNTIQEVKLFSERQEKVKDMVEHKIRLQSRVTGKYYEQFLKERKELEEKKSKEALLPVHKKHILMKYQNERDEARRLQRSGRSRGTRKEADLQDLLTMESCRSPAVDYFEEIRPEAPTKMQDEQEE